MGTLKKHLGSSGVAALHYGSQTPVCVGTTDCLVTPFVFDAGGLEWSISLFKL